MIAEKVGSEDAVLTGLPAMLPVDEAPPAALRRGPCGA